MDEKVSEWVAAMRGAPDASRQLLAGWLGKQTHRFTITGLSRSGKSMLFTSLMTMLKYRTEAGYECLPLLTRLPTSLVDSMYMEPLPGFEMFPVDEHLAALESGKWPQATDTAYGFRLIVRLTEQGRFKRWLMPYSEVVFEFIDYPGEWVTDLPLLEKTYNQWSDSAWAQQSGGPQHRFSTRWREFIQDFDFEQEPTEARIAEVVSEYRAYLAEAKREGITMLQPGSFLLENDSLSLTSMGFSPLPSTVTSDPSHPWLKAFTANFSAFKKDWLAPLKDKVFREADKQIILIDVFEGLNHSREHLYQLKETLSHLAETFVYGESNWLSRTLLRREKISKVAFVGSKADSVPVSERDALLSLLTQLTEGARAKFGDKEVDFEHFLVSAIEATDEGEARNAVRYRNQHGDYVEASFEPFPKTLKDMESDTHYPVLDINVPKDFLPRILNSRGMDRLLQFLLG
ncbi:YcjX family protein [Alteromonas halophila]|uniref:YcjX family protein n=1 Tax=Alteromonas halophila TaxID=516698 RepID=A0A918MZC2_9ALTE|nr:YcjX family protein [Alteromonas halophila]GGW84660.1 hypothetical protein GCM10007391_18010 [Alteromonas halophila]